MPFHSECDANVDEEARRDIEELEQLVPLIPDHQGDMQFQNHLFELLEQLQDLCPYSVHASLIRKLVARFGDAYFYFNQTGDLCLLTDFARTARIVF